jgi:hypothetical protein
MLVSLRLPLKNGKYAYVKVKAVFNEEVEVHIIDREKPKSGVSILDCIEEVQEQIIKELAAHDFAVQFISHSRWILYGKNGEMAEYRTIGGNKKLTPYNPVLDKELLHETLARKGETLEMYFTTKPVIINEPVHEKYEQLSLF